MENRKLNNDYRVYIHMDSLPTTPEELVNNIHFNGSDSIEYVDDIGLAEKDGLGISAKLPYKGEEISVLGSIVIEDGEPVTEDEGTSFVAYPNGLIESSSLLLEGEDAIKAAVILYDMRKNDEEPFSM